MPAALHTTFEYMSFVPTSLVAEFGGGPSSVDFCYLIIQLVQNCAEIYPFSSFIVRWICKPRSLIYFPALDSVQAPGKEPN